MKPLVKVSIALAGATTTCLCVTGATYDTPDWTVASMERFVDTANTLFSPTAEATTTAHEKSPDTEKTSQAKPEREKEKAVEHLNQKIENYQANIDQEETNKVGVETVANERTELAYTGTQTNLTYGALSLLLMGTAFVLAARFPWGRLTHQPCGNRP